MVNPLFEPLKEKNFSIKNRFYKAAMSETLANHDGSPNEKLIHLYNRWALGGAGILITGNVMIDHNALGEPGNVVVENERDLPKLKRWAHAGTQFNTHLFMQLNHPGKQSPKSLSKQPVAPSAIALGGAMQDFFNPPRALTENEIKDLIQRFANTARIAKKAGFTGVQIHAAHGYLINQFLSPYHNQRTDQWGGSLENRMRFLMEIYNAIRDQVGDDFPIAIKLNSADFQRGGFTEDESMKVLKAIDSVGIDLIEITGGNYENPAMFSNKNIKESTKQREAYFLDYAKKAYNLVNAPLVVTGGFRSKQGMEDALKNGGIEMVGLAKPFAIYPDLPLQIKDNTVQTVHLPKITTGLSNLDKKLGSMLELSWYEAQFTRMAKGRNPKPNMCVWTALFNALRKNGWSGIAQRRS